MAIMHTEAAPAAPLARTLRRAMLCCAVLCLFRAAMVRHSVVWCGVVWRRVVWRSLLHFSASYLIA